MSRVEDRSGAIVRPPIALALAILVGVGVDRLYPAPIGARSFLGPGAGIAVFGGGLALAIWAIVTIRKAGSRVETNKPTSTIVTNGPYRFTRNPIYVGMLLGQLGLALGLDSLWVLVMLAPFYLVIRYGVIAREEAYLERKFGRVYLDYKSRVRRWV